MKIVIPQIKNQQLEEILKRELPTATVTFVDEENHSLKQERIYQELPDTDVLIPERYPVTKEMIAAAPLLRLIHCGTGFNNVDLASAAERGIAVAATPGVVAPSVAEHVFSLIHALYKKTGELDCWTKQGCWDTATYGPLTEIAGKTIGLVGFGDIGSKVGNLANAYGMKVVTTRRKEVPPVTSYPVTLLNLDRLLADADIVSLHVPLTPETKLMIGPAQFKMMKRSAYLINTARGALVDEEALVKALQENEIAGAGIDVYTEEPISPPHPLLKAPRVILTPHVAYLTREALERRFAAYAANIKRLEAGAPLQNLVFR